MKHSSVFWYRSLALFCLSIGFSISVQAQTVNLGDDVSRPIPGVGHDYVHGLSETVNPANGNVHVHIDLPVPKGRGFTLPFAITYDSGELYHVTTRVTGVGVFGPPLYNGTNEPTDLSQAGNGWGNTVPYVTASGFAVGVPMAPYFSNIAWQCPMSSSYNFYDPNGGSHTLGLAAIGVGVMEQTATQPSQACAGLTYNGFGYAYYTLGGDDQVYGQMDAPCNGAYQGVDYPTDCQYASPAFTVTDQNGTVYMFASNGVSSRVGTTPGSGSSFMFPALIEDRNGNIIDFTSSGGVYGLPVTDSAGRPLITSGCAGTCGYSPTSYTVGGLTYTLTYGNIESANFSVGYTQVGNQLGCNFQNSATYTNRQVLTGITLPNGLSYSFGYDATYGLLNRITYPDGGWVHYTWALSTAYSTLASFYSSYDVGGLCNFEYQTPVIVQRQVGYSVSSTAAQTQTFANLGTNTNWVGTTALWSTKNAAVTTTDNVTGNTLVTKYTYGYVYQPYQPDSSGLIQSQLPVENTVQYLDANNNVLKTITKTWADQFEMTSETTTLLNAGSYGVAYCYRADDCTKASGFPGLAFVKYEYDFGQVPPSMPPSVSSPGAAARTTTYGAYATTLPCHFTAPITYQTNPVPCPINFTQVSINSPSTYISFLNQVVTYAGSATYNSGTRSWSGTRVAETDAYFDGQTSFTGSIAATGNPVNGLPSGTHDEANYAYNLSIGRGNPTTLIKWASTGTSPTVKYTFDETGQVQSKVDACGNPSCGDVTGSNHTTTYSYTDSPSGGNQYGASNTYLTQITYPTSADGIAQQEKFSYNYPTGQLASATDRNSKPTSYTYSDPLNRLTQTNFPDGGETTIAYNDSVPSVTTSTLLNSGVWETKVAIMDGMRHVTQTQLTDSDDGPDLVDASYDGAGHVLTQSNPHRSASALTDGTTLHSYEALGRPIKLVHPDGNTQQWCYNDIVPATGIYCNTHQGSVTTGTWVDFTDERGNHWQRTSDSLGRLTEVMEPDGVNQTVSLETDYSYDSLDNLLSVNQKGKVGTDTPRPTRTFTYDSLSRLTQAYNPESGWVCYGTTGGAAANGSNCTSGYDANGNLGAKTDARGVTISYNYDVLNRILGKTYSNSTALPVSYSYDTSSISGATNNVGRLASESLTNGSTLVAWRAPYAYDAMGRLQNEQQCTPANCAGTAYTPAYTYDLAGGVLTATPGLPTSVVGVPSSAMQFSYTYDSVERLRSVTSNIAQSQNYPSTLFLANAVPSYGPMGLMNAQYGVNSSTGLSALTLTRTYDNRGRVLSETDEATSQATGSTGSVTIAGTEQSGNPGKATISINSIPAGPDSGIFTVTVGSIQRQVHWSESPSGMSTSTFAGMIVTAFSGNTLVSVMAAGSQVTVTSNLVGSGSNYSLSISQSSSNGQLISYSGPSSLSGGASPGTTYDAGTASVTIDGSISTVSWGNGSTGANIASALASAIQAADSSFLTATPSGSVVSLTSVEKGTGADWSVTTGITYDSTNFTSPSFSISSSGMSGGGGGSVYSYLISSSGGYDGAGNVTSVNDSVTGNWGYTYDTLNRLITGTPSSGSYNGQYGCWAYDDFGNRTHEAMSTTPCNNNPLLAQWATYTTTNSNRMDTTSTNANQMNGYDAAGNVLNDGVNQYLYDAEGRLCAVKSFGTVTEYVYDAEGSRVAKGTLSSWPSACVAPTAANGFTLTTSYVLGPGGEQVSELSISGSTSTWVHTNIFVDGTLLATYHDTNTYFALTDRLGTKRAEYTPNGLLSTFFSLPYGNGLSSSGNAGDPAEQHFTGKERDSESGLDDFGARYFGSSMGRFMTPDDFWKDSNVADPQSWNKYAYARNNPLRYTDPTGEEATVTTSCNQDHTTCQVNVTASIAIYSVNGTTADQLKQAQSAITSQIDKAWSGSFSQDGTTYNVTTNVTVSIASSADAAFSSGAQNAVGISTNADVQNHLDAGPRGSGQDRGVWDFSSITSGQLAPHEFSHALGLDDNHGNNLSNSFSNASMGDHPHASAQDLQWAFGPELHNHQANFNVGQREGRACPFCNNRGNRHWWEVLPEQTEHH